MSETVDRLIDALNPVAQRIGEGAEHVYRLAVRQAIIEGIASLVLAVVLAVLVYVGVRVLLWFRVQYESARERHRYDGDGWAFGGWLLGFAVLACAIGAIGCAFDGAVTLANPEYAAIENLLEAVRS